MNIVFLQCTQSYGYAFSAANVKTEFLARGFVELGDTVTIVNSVVGSNMVPSHEKVQRTYCPVISYHLYYNRFVSWIVNVPKLYADLESLYIKGQKNILILEFPDYHLYLLYVLIGRLLGYKITVISHEWGPTVKSVHILRKPSVWLYSKTFGYLSDCILPISQYIIDKIQKFKKPYLKLPILADFNGNKDVDLPLIDGDYFAYCGQADYYRAYNLLLEGFVLHHKKHFNTKLILVLSGKQEYIDKVNGFIQSHHLDGFVFVKQKVPYNELLNFYQHAKALLIPLDPASEQDKARFSQKIAEYISTKTPIITNNVGEIPYYFTDRENAIVLNSFSGESFSGAMNFSIENKDAVHNIGINGFDLGREKFDYKSNVKSLQAFFAKI